MRAKIEIVLNWIGKHKYWLSIVIFIMVVGFFDSHSYIKRMELCESNDSLRTQLAYYEEICRRDSTRLKQLQSDPRTLVRVAREDYLMKSPNEDVYIIIEE